MAKILERTDRETGEVSLMKTPFLDDHGREILDPTPLQPPVGWYKTPSMFDLVRDQVRRELSAQAEAQGMESFEDADDFDVGDDFDPTSPYEERFDYAPASAAELRRRAAEAEAVAAQSDPGGPLPAAPSPVAPPPASAPPAGEPGAATSPAPSARP